LRSFGRAEEAEVQEVRLFPPASHAVGKPFSLKEKAFPFKREDLSPGEGKLFPGFEKGVESLCADNQHGL